MRYLLTILTILFLLVGCSPKDVAAPSERSLSVLPTAPYTFITGKTSATSWGDVYYNGAKIGYGNLPVACGSYVYFIKYHSDFIPPFTPPVTEPVKYNIATGTLTSLGAKSSGFDMWNKIDATTDGTYMVGKFSKTYIKKNGSTTTLYYVTNGELSDDGAYFFYIQSNKAYKMNLATKAKVTVCSIGYGAEVSTNKDGTKAIIVTSVNGAYKVYTWNGSLSELGTGYAYYNGVDMDAEGLFVYSANGKIYNGGALIGTGVHPVIGADGILYGNNGNLVYYDFANCGTTIVAGYATAVQQCAWGK